MTVLGAQSRGVMETAANGGEALARIAEYYFGSAGAFVLAAIVTVACLKTAVGLITSCGETFSSLVPGGPSYSVWAAGFCVLSFLIANLGLDTILAYSAPVLMFLYPLAIVLVLLTLFGKAFGNDRLVMQWTVGFTAAAAVFDFLKALPGGSFGRASAGADNGTGGGMDPPCGIGIWLGSAGLPGTFDRPADKKPADGGRQHERRWEALRCRRFRMIFPRAAW